MLTKYHFLRTAANHQFSVISTIPWNPRASVRATTSDIPSNRQAAARNHPRPAAAPSRASIPPHESYANTRESIARKSGQVSYLAYIDLQPRRNYLAYIYTRRRSFYLYRAAGGKEMAAMRARESFLFLPRARARRESI